MNDPRKNSPDVFAWPPLIFAAAFGAGLGLQWFFPIFPLPFGWSSLAGMFPCVASAAICFPALYQMRSVGTSIRPTKPAKQLVISGPFRFSRNPLYLGVTLLYAGLTLQLNAFWPWLTLLPALWFVHHRIILREEEYLENKFGEEYRAYKKRVRRWL